MTSHDITTIASVTIIITLVGVVATPLPAYRATRVDPVIALRDEP